MFYFLNDSIKKKNLINKMSSETNFSLRSNYKTLDQTGPNWQSNNISRQDTQIVAVTPPDSYDILMHNVPATGDGYFKIYDAYNNIFSTSEGGYQYVNRKCYGELKR